MHNKLTNGGSSLENRGIGVTSPYGLDMMK